MKVIFIPDYSDGNPYQRQLIAALSQKGIAVSLHNATGIWAWFKIIRLARDADIVHLHWILTLVPQGRTPLRTRARIFFFYFSLWVIRLLRIKIVWTVHNKYSHDCKNPRLELLARREIAQISKKIFVHGPSVIDELASLYIVRPEKFIPIAHGHYMDACPNTVDTATARQKLKIPADRLVYLNFGSMKGYKGVQRIIDVFKDLRLPQSELVLAGPAADPSILSDIEKRCAGQANIHFINAFIQDEEMQYYLNAADVAVFAFDEILTSGSLIMALSFQKAVIAPALGCIPDVVDEKGAILFNPDDPDGLKKAFLESQQADLKAMGEYNYQRALQLKWSNMAETIHDIYQNI